MLMAHYQKIYSEYKDYNLAAKYYLPIINSLDFSSISELNLIPILNGYTFFSAADSSYAQYADKCLFAARNYIEKKSTAKFNSLLYFQLSHYFFNNNNIDSGIIYANKSIQNIIEHPNSSDKIQKPFFELIKFYINNDQYNAAALQVEALLKLTDTSKMDIYDKITLFQYAFKSYQNIGKQKEYFYYLGQYEICTSEYKEGERVLGLYQRLSEINQYYNSIELEKLYAEKKAHRFYIYCLSLFIIACLFSFILYSVIANSRKKAKELEQKQVKLLKEIEYQQRLYDERCRIAQEIHDDLGTTVTSIIMRVEMAKRLPVDSKILDHLSTSADEIYNQLNEVIWNLNVKNDNVGSLSNYILCFAKSFFEQIAIEIKSEVKCTNPEMRIDGHRRRLIFLCCKELINNIAKHSKATKVELRIYQVDNNFTVEVCDNGIGMVASKANANARKGGNGIGNIKLQVATANGLVEWFENTDGCGCKAIISFFI